MPFRDKFDSFLFRPFLVFSLFIFVLFTIFYLFAFLPFYSQISSQKTKDNRVILDSRSQYHLGDIPLNSDGKFDIKNANGMEWPTFSDWIDRRGILRILNTENIWIRVPAKDLTKVSDPHCLFAHRGLIFQTYSDDGILKNQYGNFETPNEIPNVRDFQYSWLKIDKPSSKYYYVRLKHRKGFLFSFDAVQNEIGAKTDIIDQLAKANIISLFLYSFFVLIGIVCALVYITQYQKKYYILFDFALFSLLFGLLGFSSNEYIKYLSSDRSSLNLLSTITANLIYIPMHSGLRRIFGAGKWKILDLLIYLNIIIAIFNGIVFLYINSSHEIVKMYVELRIFYILFACLNFIGPMIVAYSAWRKGYEIGFSHFIGFSLTLILVMIEIYLAIRDNGPFTRVVYWGVLFGVFSQGLALEKSYFSNRQKMQEFEASLLSAEKTLREVQLKTLQNKMSPHYLFNSLNTIHALHQTKPELIGDAILKLANNYRFFSDKTDFDLIPFEEEWEFIEDYLHIQKLRFYDTVKIILTKEGNFDRILIPPLTLQPIIENSFKHGFRLSSSANWMIDISAKISTSGSLVLKISDTGSGLSDEILAEESLLWGRSLGNIRERISHYFKNSKIKVARNFPTGLITTLTIEGMPNENPTRVKI